MGTVSKYAFAAALIGLIPASGLFLIFLELGMVYHLSVINKRPFNLGELGIIWTILVTIGGILQVIVGTIFDFAGPVGWIAKAGIALTFVLCFGGLVSRYYEAENAKRSAL